MRKRLTLTREQVASIHRFLWTRVIYHGPAPLNGYGYQGITAAQRTESYHSWARGGHAWKVIEQGGTGILAALCWYQHVHKPGSREWRPSVIITALLAAATEGQPCA